MLNKTNRSEKLSPGKLNMSGQRRKSDLWRTYWDEMARQNTALDQVNRKLRDLKREERFLVGQLGITSGDDVLDVCCGNGLISLKVAEQCSKVVGIDLSEEMIARARVLSRRSRGSNCDFQVASATSVPLAPNSMDLAYCLTSFHYFPGYSYAKQVIHEVLRVVKPGGAFLITEVPDSDSWAHTMWQIIRNPKGEDAFDTLKTKASRSSVERLKKRVQLLFRRITGKKVASDSWTWYSRKEVRKMARTYSDSPCDVDIWPAHTRSRLASYRFDALVYKLQPTDGS